MHLYILTSHRDKFFIMSNTQTSAQILKLNDSEKKEIVSFLSTHLEEYGDSTEDIEKAVNYAMGLNSSPGGLLVTSWDKEELIGVAVTNRTGMDGYIPQNILVYIATHKEYRGIGIGKQLLGEIIEQSEGDIALHVEPDNPAKRLYESFGFNNKYLEMRLKRNN